MGVDMNEKRNRQKSALERAWEFDKAMKAFDGSTWALLNADQEDAVSIKLLQKGEADWMAIGERYWETETKLVTFASGKTPWEALVNLSHKWFHRDAWKAPKPWGGGRG